MTYQEAADFLAPALIDPEGTWADIGAGTGVFTMGLRTHLPVGSRILAVDKNPHSLWSLPLAGAVPIEVVEADFTRLFDLALCQGMVMANALHYAKDHQTALAHVIAHLAVGGSFVLIEYDTDRGGNPWVPYPLSLQTFERLAPKVGLSIPQQVNYRRSQYGYRGIYVALCHKEGG